MLLCGFLPPRRAEAQATVEWVQQGILVRFPPEVSPVQISRDTVVGDRFSGYEWRVVLERGQASSLVAFVIPPHPERLTLVRYVTNEAAIRAGGARVRRCEPDFVTIRCGRPARGLVRLAGARLELVISEPWWLSTTDTNLAEVHLAVRRGGTELWSGSESLPARMR